MSEEIDDLLSGMTPEDLAGSTPQSMHALRLHKEMRDTEQKLRDSRREIESLRVKLSAAVFDLNLAERKAQLSDAVRKDEYTESYDFKEISCNGDATAILCLNDWHVEETIDPDLVYNLNRYNLEVAAKRIENVGHSFLKVLKSARVLSNINDLVIAVLGDLINGYIHEEMVEDNQLPPTEALLFARRHLKALIEFILANTDFEKITIATSYGNHGRTTRKPMIATAYANSYEWLIYEVMADEYKDHPRVNWVVSKSYFNNLNIQGKRVRFHHGDFVNYQGGVGGLMIPLRKSIHEWNQSLPADLDVLGHWHQFLRSRNAVVSNCLVGTSPYSFRIKAAHSEPSQTMIVMDRDRPSPVDVREVYCE
jgi:hypothetical protein